MMSNIPSPYGGSIPAVSVTAPRISPLPSVDAESIPEANPETTLNDAALVIKEGEVERIERLAALKPMEYDRVRKEEAKLLGVQVKTLDDMVKVARSENGEGKKSPFPDVEMHPDPVDPVALLNEVSDIIRRFIVLDKEQADAAALWVTHTHLVDEADVSPIAIINAPEKACAKTLFQTVLGRMAYRPLPASNASLSALFRAVEAWRPTLLIDEADTFFRENAELHGLVNAGYKRDGFVLRSESTGDSFEPRMFSVYGAKSIAGIALERHLPDSTMSRGVVFNLRRKLPDESVHRMRHADAGMFEQVTAKLARFAYDNSERIRRAHPTLPEELSDRAQDNWEPLLAIAECGGKDWLQRAISAALKLSSSSDQAVSTSNDLLADIQLIFDGRQGTKISTADLIAALVDDDEKSWATYNRGKPLTPRQLAKQLSVYGIKSKTVRLGQANTPKGYEVSQFDDAFERYLPGSRKLPQQRNDSPEPCLDSDGNVADVAAVAEVASVADAPGSALHNGPLEKVF